MTRNQCRLTLETLEHRTLLSTCHVTRLSDSGIGKGFRGDLRYCVNKVNTEPGPDTIDFTVTGTINLNSALPDLSSEIDIQGRGADVLTIRRNATQRFRIFRVLGGANVQLSGLTMSNGELHSGGDVFGAGVHNAGTLLIRACNISNNTLLTPDFGHGAGIYNVGNLTVIDTTIESNAIQAFLAFGGGISNAGTASIYGSTISGNYAGTDSGDNGFGGGIANTGVMTILNSTVDSNSTKNGVGGGVYANSGSITITSSTIADNVADEKGGGIYIASNAVHLRNTIVEGNRRTTPSIQADDIWGALASSTHNLIGHSSGGSGYSMTDILNVDPMLGALADNGGPTKTRSLPPESPAVNAGDNTAAPEWDQRGTGFPRIVDGVIDIGAFEVQSAFISSTQRLNHPTADHRLSLLLTADLDRSE